MANEIVTRNGAQIDRPLMVAIPGDLVQSLVNAIVELSGEGEIRVTEDGRFSVLDVIESVGCKGNPRDAWKRLQTEHPEVVEKTDSLKLPRSNGRAGGMETPVTDLAGCLEIIWLLPGEISKKMRRIGAQINAAVIQEAAKPQSTADMLIEMAYAFKEHENRLTAIEAENLELKRKLLEQEQELLLTKQKAEETKLLAETISLETEANAAELDRYKNGHGRWYTVMAWCNLHGYNLSLQGCTLMGRKAAAICRSRNIPIQPVSDPRFGTVNSYPDTILMELDW